ncbi:MAG: insulinase family protein [Lachnospiraceae bacterium]|nr:insulinase family protein [Lachnospiraceae bacterium]
MYSDTAEKLKKLTAYEILSAEELGDIHADGILLRHRKSGAVICLLSCDDDNKVFDITFRTPPADSTGVAHIIEHTVLCGSEKFPLKDPFVELVKGSLNTFLNAITYPDKTTYPVASTNDADFRNLMHIYLDAVFRPNIYHEKNIFRQEGWHYELEDTEKPLTVNGVVYNEMKGAFSSADSVLSRETMNALFPDTAYGVESGGDPDVIPELTYEQYLDFHRRYHHPSNSWIYLYGDMDMVETLQFIDEEYLSGYELQPIDSMPAYQKPFEAPQTVRRTFPVTDEEAEDTKGHLSLSFLTGDAFSLKESIAFEVLDYALFSMPGAPVRQALLDAGIGSDVYGEFMDGILQNYFSVVAKDAPESDAERFCEIIRTKLQEQVEQGIDRKSLIAGLNSFEFQYREADFGSYPKGLMYGLSILDTWLYDKNRPFDTLKRLSLYEELRNAADSGYFEELVRTRLLENPHSAMVVLVPETGLLEKKEKELADKLAAYKASLSKEELEQIAAETVSLREWQDEEESEEAIATIPLLSRSDLRREITHFSNIEEKVELPDGRGEVPVVFHDAQTNGILYQELLFDLGHVAEEDLPYLGVLKTMLMNLDTEQHSYLDLNNEINAETGGIGTYFNITEHEKDQDYDLYFAVRGKALYAKAPRMFELMKEVICSTKFDDEKKLREVIAQTRSQQQMSLMQSGNTYAAMRASAYTSGAAAARDRISGIAFYRFLKDLEDHFEERAAQLSEKLAGLAKSIFAGDALLVSCTAEEEGRALLREKLALCVPEEKAGKRERAEVKPYGVLNEGFRTAGQVQFVAACGNYRKAGIPFNGAMHIVRQMLSYEYLWQNVRVQGGAYGCGGYFQKNGYAVFSSYRDPHLKRTYDIYKKVPEYLASFQADERTMTKFIIGTMSGVDQPMSPSTFGAASMRVYLNGVTEEERQKSRNQLLDATTEDIRALAQAAQAALDDCSICVIGGETAIEKDKELFGRIENLL